MYSSTGIDFSSIHQTATVAFAEVLPALNNQLELNRKRAERSEEVADENERYYEEQMAKRQCSGSKDIDEEDTFDDTCTKGYTDRDAHWGIAKLNENDYVPCRDPFQTEIETLLRPGEPAEFPPELCFACRTGERGGTNYIWADKWLELERVFKRGLVETGSLVVLAQQLHIIFHHRIVCSIRETNSKEDADQILGPPDKEVWTPYQIIVHFADHTLDPEVNIAMDLKRLKMMKRDIFTYESTLVHRETGHRVRPKEAIAKIKEIHALEKGLYSLKPETMLFVQKDSRIPTEYLKMNPGYIEGHTRQFIRASTLQHQFGGTHKQFR